VEKKKILIILVENPEEIRPQRRPGYRWKINITIDVK
jgi:hypothetical protein